MTRLIALRLTDLAANRFAIIRPSRAPSCVSAAARGVVTTNKAPLAKRLPFRADAYSEGRCKRAAGGNVARMALCAPAISSSRRALRLLKRPDAYDPSHGAL